MGFITVFEKGAAAAKSSFPFHFLIFQI